MLQSVCVEIMDFSSKYALEVCRTLRDRYEERFSAGRKGTGQLVVYSFRSEGARRRPQRHMETVNGNGLTVCTKYRKEKFY